MAVKSELVSRVSKVTRNAEHCHQATMHDSCKFLSWICSTLTETRLRSVAPAGSFRSLSGLTSFRPSANPLITQSLSHLITSQKAAFTLAEGRLAWQTKSAFTHRETAKEVRSTIIYNVPRHKATEPKTCNHSITQSLNHLVTSKKAAFTLAEVLITLAIIGVVAVLTIPGLIKNHNEKAWSTAQSVFEKRLEVATRQMNTEEKLSGYANTMDFVNELKNKIKIINVCDSNNLSKCFENTILTADGQEVDAANLKTSAQLAKEDWGTETVGVQFADGVSALIAYNPNTDQQPFNNQFSATEASMAILYDVSGYKNPNTLGKDVNQNANVTDLGCMINPDLLGGMCIKKILAPGTYSPMNAADCNAQKGDLGIKACYYDDDYFAGAVKACGRISNIPSMEQLGQLAEYLYDTDSIGTYKNYNGALNTTKASQFLSDPPFYVWSTRQYGSYTYVRYFDSTNTNTYIHERGRSGHIAVCVDK